MIFSNSSKTDRFSRRQNLIFLVVYAFLSTSPGYLHSISVYRIYCIYILSLDYYIIIVLVCFWQQMSWFSERELLLPVAYGPRKELLVSFPALFMSPQASTLRSTDNPWLRADRFIWPGD